MTSRPGPCRVRGRAAASHDLESRPAWREDIGTEWTRFPIARLRYSKGSRRWALYWRDRDLGFHVYDRVAPSSRVGELLQEMASAAAIFWGQDWRPGHDGVGQRPIGGGADG